MRVIAGKFRSRVLQSLPGLDIRPTSDKLRETLFNILTAGNSSALEGKIWIDLFAGTGAVGIEAISRGSSLVHFVESSPGAAELIKRNLRSLGIESGFSLSAQDVVRALRTMAGKNTNFDIVFLDPPYQLEDAYSKTLLELSTSALLTSETRVIAEHQRKFDPGEKFGELERYRKLEQGQAALSFYRLKR
ncbi:MAG: 16S rRNA (guanine(966)-N(2))-methyltransferase RsmD [Terriglobales bacterium]